MALPSLAIPEDTITLYSTQKPIRIRPYLVGEEKLLLIAQAADDEKEVLKAVKQLIRRCTFDTVNPDTLPMFDIEWVFLQLRARSVSNVIEVKFRCIQDEVDANTGNLKPCDTLVPVNIDIADIKMDVAPEHSNKVWLDEAKTIGVTLKYPTTDISESQDVTEIIVAHLDTIFTAAGEVSEVAEQPLEEVKAWVDTLSLAHVAKIRTFFETMPRLTYTFQFRCPKCKHEEPVTLRGLLDFFE